MQDPEPVKDPVDWTPHRKIVGGSAIGIAAGQVIILACDQYLSKKLNPELISAITGLCVAVAAYFIPNPQGT